MVGSAGAAITFAANAMPTRVIDPSILSFKIDVVFRSEMENVAKERSSLVK